MRILCPQTHGHEAKRKVVMPTKKTPAQLQREIDETLSGNPLTGHEKSAPSLSLIQKMASQLTLEELQRFTDFLATDRGWQTIHLWFQKTTDIRTARGK